MLSNEEGQITQTQVRVSTKQLLEFAPYRKQVGLDDRLYAICVLPENCFQKRFISAQKEKNQCSQPISLAAKFQILYVELLSTKPATNREHTDQEWQNNLILYEMIRKILKEPQQQFRIYDIRQLQYQYEFRQLHDKNEVLGSDIMGVQLIRKLDDEQQIEQNMEVVQVPLNVYHLQQGTLEEVGQVITIDCAKAYKTMSHLEIEVELQRITGEIWYEYSNKQKGIVTNIFIASNRGADLLSNLLHLFSSPLKDCILFRKYQNYSQSYPFDQNSRLEANQEPIDASGSNRMKMNAQVGLIKYFELTELMLVNKANDFTFLKTIQDHLCEKIGQVVQSADLCGQDLLVRVRRMLRILEFRRIKMEVRMEEPKQRLNLFQILYERLAELLKQACVTLNIGSVEKDVSLRLLGASSEQTRDEEIAKQQYKYQLPSSTENILDRLFINYYKQTARKGEQQKMYISFENGKKSELKTFLAGLINHTKYPQMWRDIFSKAKLAIKQAKMPKNQKMKNAQSSIINKQGESLWPNAAQQKLRSIKQNNMNCIGCYTFFTKNESIVGSQQMKIIYHENIKNIMGQQKLLLSEVCGLLNQNGGFILFNVEVGLSKVLCKGAYVNQRERLGYVEFIQRMFNKIKPTPEKNKDYTVSFVPVNEELSEPLQGNWKEYEQETKKGQYYIQNKKIEGLFVARIKVSPQKQVGYYLSEQFGQNKQQNTKKKQFSLNPFVPSPRRLFLHSCKTIQDIINQDEFQLLNYHILIIKSINVPDLVKRMQSLKMRFQFENRFLNRQFPILRFVTIIQHAQTHEYIAKNISSIVYDDKHVLTIEVRFFIRLVLEKPLDEKTLEEIGKQFQEEFPGEEMRYYASEAGGGCEYYIKTFSKLATIFMYLLFSSLNKKAIIKDPDTPENLLLLKRIGGGRQK